LTASQGALAASASHRLEPLAYAAGPDGPSTEDLLHERYRRRGPARPLLSAFYRLKPALPRAVQLAARRAYARRLRHGHDARSRFPRWPIEPVLVERLEAHLRDRLGATGLERVPLIGLWPDGHRFAFILTHDVEGPRGLANVPAVLEVEHRHGMLSSWNLVADEYAIDPAMVAAIREAGCEIGLHGLRHDGRLFESRAAFERELPGIRDRAAEWGVEGFRSPSTLRNASWMAELPVSYDSSFPDTDPFEPHPGGCCSILPFFLGEVVELPLTLTQDHTLFEILRERDISLWRRKATWIARHGGLVTVLVHPDYMVGEERLSRYDELLSFLGSIDGGWHALPREVARWWRRRAALEDAIAAGEPFDDAGWTAAGACLAWAQERDGAIVLETGVEG
jgi:peptidoglycan/xylan/chitin deacetylase (PgdA/CDA1 family)